MNIIKELTDIYPYREMAKKGFTMMIAIVNNDVDHSVRTYVPNMPDGLRPFHSITFHRITFHRIIKIFNELFSIEFNIIMRK